MPRYSSTIDAPLAMSAMTRSGKESRYCSPVFGLTQPGPVEPWQLPREFTQITKWRSVSMALPGPIIGSHQPSVGSSALLAAWALGDRPVSISTALERSASSSPQVS